MLVLNKVCSQKMISLMLDRFDALDVDGSGQLTREDIIIATSHDETQRREATMKRKTRRDLFKNTLRATSAFSGSLKKKAGNQPQGLVGNPEFDSRFKLENVDETLDETQTEENPIKLVISPEELEALQEQGEDMQTTEAEASVEGGSLPNVVTAADEDVTEYEDLRKLTLKEAKRRLIEEYGADPDFVGGKSRFELVAMLRDARQPIQLSRIDID